MCGTASERGIYFITEWLSNWLSVQLGPLLYGLPYRSCENKLPHAHEENFLSGRVETGEMIAGFSITRRSFHRTKFCTMPAWFAR